MKKFNRIFGLLVLVSMISFTSCEDENPDDMFGDPLEKFLGDWKCYETGDLQGPFGPYDVKIVRNPDNSSEVLIRNIYYLGMDVSARAIIAGNTITIPQQNICDDTIGIRGSGRFSDGEINISYKTDDGADEENVEARYYKP